MLRWLVRLLGPLLLVWLLSRIPTRSAFERLHAVDAGTLALSTALLLLSVTIKAQRWRSILRAESVHCGLLRATLTYLVAIALGALTPGRLGELYRAWPVAREAGVPLERVLPSVLLDRFFDQGALAGVALLGLYLLPGAPLGLRLLVVGSALVALALTVALSRPGTADILSRRPALAKLGTLVRGLQRVPAATLGAAAGLTCLAYLVFFVQCVLLARALALPASSLAVVAASALGNIAALLPVTLFGVGTREATVLTVLGQVGVTAGAALSYSLLLAAVSYGTALMFGALAGALRARFGGRFVELGTGEVR